MKELVIVLANKDKETLGRVRCFPDLLVAQQDEDLWIRGIENVQNIDLAIRQLPVKQTYWLDDHNFLFPYGALTPVSKLKDMSWTHIRKFITPELPTSAMPGRVSEKHPFQLVASKQVQEGIALLTALSLWKEYAATAPEVRLAQLRFAVSEHNQALIVGTPLPPIPGKEYWVQQNLLVPGGYEFELPLVASLLSAKLNPGNDSVLVFDANGNWEKISLEEFVTATRSAVRLTKGKE